MPVKVTLDHDKNLANQQKDGVSFEEASEIFVDNVDTLDIFDDTHSEFEDRFISIGPIKRGLVLVVWTERDADIVRIISARWATRSERAHFHDALRRST